MAVSGEMLPSWRPGATRDAVVGFLDAALDLPADHRVACLDNDGTLWCERPSYVQFDFLAHALAGATTVDPALRERPELAAVLDRDLVAIEDLGIERVALALIGLFTGHSPEEYTAAVQAFLERARNPLLDRPLVRCTYQPMLELLDELRRRSFTVAIVTGGGVEFVRAISQQLYGVPPELVVGTAIDYETGRDHAGNIVLRRTGSVSGGAVEGAAKVASIQAHLGRRPVLAAGNSAGDREMLEWALAPGRPSLALLVDHDDAEREFAYESVAATVADAEPIVDVGRRAGFTVVSMANDWDTVFTGPT